MMEEELARFDEELLKGEALNGQKIYTMLHEVIEDRLHMPAN
jgi:hypothetical protein